MAVAPGQAQPRMRPIRLILGGARRAARAPCASRAACGAHAAARAAGRVRPSGRGPLPSPRAPGGRARQSLGAAGQGGQKDAGRGWAGWGGPRRRAGANAHTAHAAGGRVCEWARARTRVERVRVLLREARERGAPANARLAHNLAAAGRGALVLDARVPWALWALAREGRGFRRAGPRLCAPRMHTPAGDAAEKGLGALRGPRRGAPRHV